MENELYLEGFDEFFSNCEPCERPTVRNANLHKGMVGKHDEFYTRYGDIKKEIDLYYEYDNAIFRGKTIYCPCDDPRKSNFTRYFIENFDRFGLRKLICSCHVENGVGRAFEYEGERELPKDISMLECVKLKGDGDFRSGDVSKYFDEADIVITNPPFSLFRQFVDVVMSHGKKFIAIGNLNCITYRCVYERILKNEVWLGHGIGRWISGFIVPDDYEFYGTETRIDEDANRIISTNGCLWLTNLDHGKRHRELKLKTEAENRKSSSHEVIRNQGYLRYDNCDAIDVPYTDAIPSDYEGVMGVPITFLDKYCPDQFEILRFRKGDDGRDLSVNGKSRYCRILIRKRK